MNPQAFAAEQYAEVFCLSRTLSFDDVLEFSTARQEKLDVKAKVFHA